MSLLCDIRQGTCQLLKLGVASELISELVDQAVFFEVIATFGDYATRQR
jgi:hypothetical protein